MLFAADSFVFILRGFAHCLFLQDDVDVFLQFKGKKGKKNYFFTVKYCKL